MYFNPISLNLLLVLLKIYFLNFQSSVAGVYVMVVPYVCACVCMHTCSVGYVKRKICASLWK